MKYCDMTTEQRDRLRRLQNRLCIKAVEYKGIKDQACATCESPCRYGMEALDILGIPKPQARAEGLFHKPAFGKVDSIRRIMTGMKRRWK